MTAAVSGRPYQCEMAYDIPGLNKNLDYINLMTYDYISQSSSRTGFNAPLYNASDNIVQYWIEKGANPNKIILGLPLYGYSFLLDNSANNGVGALVKGPANVSGRYSNVSFGLVY